MKRMAPLISKCKFSEWPSLEQALVLVNQPSGNLDPSLQQNRPPIWFSRAPPASTSFSPHPPRLTLRSFTELKPRSQQEHLHGHLRTQGEPGSAVRCVRSPDPFRLHALSRNRSSGDWSFSTESVFTGGASSFFQKGPPAHTCPTRINPPPKNAGTALGLGARRLGTALASGRCVKPLTALLCDRRCSEPGSSCPKRATGVEEP